MDASYFVLEISLGAPNDAASEFHVLSSPREIELALKSVEPEMLLASCLALWIFQNGSAEQVIDLRRFVRVSAGEQEWRGDDEAGLDVLFGDSSSAPSIAIVWPELATVIPVLKAPLLRPGEVGAVKGSKRMTRLARETGLDSDLTGYEAFDYGPHDHA